MPWSRPWRFKSHWDTPAARTQSPARLVLDSSVTHELLYRLSRFNRIVVLQILTASQPAEGAGCRGRGGRCRGPSDATSWCWSRGWRWSGQACQKQPSTDTAIHAPRNRMSARRRLLPPRTGQSTTNLKPRRATALDPETPRRARPSRHLSDSRQASSCGSPQRRRPAPGEPGSPRWRRHDRPRDSNLVEVTSIPV